MKGVYEIFLHASKKDTFDEKVAYLKKEGDTFAVRTVLQGCYHPNIKFLLPEGDPPYQVNDPISVETRLHSLAKKLDLFVEGGRPVATQSKREMLFIELLESVHPEDAKILLRMKDKKDPVDGITYDVARATFPGMLPEREVEPVEVPAKPKRVPRTTKAKAIKSSKVAE